MVSHQKDLLVALLFCIYGLQVSWCQCVNSTALSIQVDALLAEYDRDVFPPIGDGSGRTAQVVQVTLDVRHATINEQESTMRLLTDFKMIWQDDRLKWNDTEWECDYAITAAERLWLPDIVLLNAAATGASSSPSDVGLKARIDSSGTVVWVMRLDVTAPVAMDLYDWPKDTQSCVFKFGSRAYNLDQLELVITDFKHAVVFESGAWEIKSVAGDTWSWQRQDEQQSVAGWTVQVTRRAPAQALASTTLLLASALLLAAALALPPDQRHALAACTSFITALWSSTVSWEVGGASAWCPRALRVSCGVCACGALCACGAALARSLPRCAAPPPRLLRAALSRLSAHCSLTPTPEACGGAESGAWAAAGVLLDRVVCAALALTLIVLLAVQLF